MTEPTFDAQGYPTEETLAFIRNARVQFIKLLEFVSRAWEYNEGVTVWHDEAGTHFRFLTLGWSGNEALIGALEQNQIFWLMCWESSKRGGEFEFIVPDGAI